MRYDEEYFKFLINLIGGEGYETLLRVFHDKTFVWPQRIEGDANRAQDALNLRANFFDTSLSIEEDNASFLEVLITLAIRMNDMCIGIEDADNYHYWFFLLLANLRVDDLVNEKMRTIDALMGANDILDTVLYRRYDETGFGGLFPLRKPWRDQRIIELWYQMGAFLTENYYLSE